ncbi:MAG: hypothetical protein IJR01_04990 [Bacteroidales bacterium]|nr:hypothetical protein [Bacteroidales bacterium]
MGFNTFNAIISVIGSLCSAGSLAVSIVQSIKSQKHDIKAETNTPTIESVPAQDDYKPSRWPIVVILSMVLISFIITVIQYVNSGSYIFPFCCFLSSLLAMLVYARFAYKSFDGQWILPPVKLWQVVFNKIPTYIKKSNQVVFKFLVLKFEDSDEVNDVAERISNSYKNRPDFEVIIKTQDKSINISPDYCGIIFIVGEQSVGKSDYIKKVMDSYSAQLQLPIAYIRVSDSHFRLSKYHRIGSSYIDNLCANHLIMRSYRRSELWIKLAKYYHIVAGVLFFLLCISGVVCLDLAKDNIYNNGLNKIIGGDRKEIHLENVYSKNLPDSISIDKVKGNEILRQINEEYISYHFGEIKGIQQILIWLRNNISEDLTCIFTTNHNSVQNKGNNSMIGSIAAYADSVKPSGLFVLWPGCNNTELDLYDNKFAWANMDKGLYESCEVRRLSANGPGNRGLILRRDKVSKELRLPWAIDETRKIDDDIAFISFSPNCRLAIEIDFNYEELNKSKETRGFIQNFAFRNELRKYCALLTTVIRAINDTE